MLRMILADDEPVITKGIQRLVDWPRLGIEIAGVYENGRDALHAILAGAPDVAVLDISMPGKTGLEILRELNEAGSPTRVVFLSGFQDFEFAQTALHYGAKDYLLKPVKKESLVDAVRKCVSLEGEARAEAGGEGGDGFLPAGVTRALAQTGSGQYVLCAAALPGFSGHSAIEKQFGLFSAVGRVQAYLQERGAGEAFQKDAGMWLVLAGGAAVRPEAFLAEMQASLAPECELSLVYSPAADSIGCMKDFVPECLDALGYFYFHRHLPRQVLAVGQAVFPQPCTPEEIKALRDRMVVALFEQNGEALERLAREYAHAACTISGSKSDTAVYYLLSAIRAVEERFDALGAPVGGSLIVDTMDKAREAADYSGMEEIFRKVLAGYFRRVAEIAQGSEKKDILKAKSYIEEHYAENLTLEVLAGQIHMNSFYFSSFFKKQTGENFKDYLNKTRLKHGMELLVMSDNKIYEIAEKVGFKDYRYFTELFTRHYGKTPMAYRKELAEGRGREGE